MMPARQGQAAREVRQQVWARRIALPDGQGGRLWITCLIAKERNPPEGIKPIEWRLLTNREATSFEAVAKLIDGYRARWEIETFFPVLKNGCRVEALQLASIAKLDRALAVYGVVAWRLARLVRTARTRPDLEASSLLTKEDPD